MLHADWNRYYFGGLAAPLWTLWGCYHSSGRAAHLVDLDRTRVRGVPVMSASREVPENRDVEVVNGRTYVTCVSCDGWYEKRGIRLHENSCNGECEPGRESPPSGSDPFEEDDEEAGEQVLSISDDPVLICPGCGSDNVVDAERAADAFRAQTGQVPAALQRNDLYCNSCTRAFGADEV